MRVSVVIPTYKRSRTLGAALQSLQRQTLMEFEILVVDNAADPTVEGMVADFSRTARVPARYVAEARLGLHNARHAGVRAATGDLLVFTDDDATFDPGWLSAYAEAFAKHPDIVAAGGPVRPVWDASPPEWLLEYVGSETTFPILSLTDLHQESVVERNGFFYGVNMAVRRSVFEKRGFHPELLGERTIGDGESGLQRDIVADGGWVGYVPKALIHHHIPPSRMTVDYIRRWAWHLGGAEMYERWWNKRRTPMALCREASSIVCRYWRCWAKDVLVRHRLDRKSIDTQFNASLGWCKLTYVWWMISDPTVKGALDMKRFCP